MVDSNEITRSFFESLLLEMRHIGSGVAEKITSITNELKGVMSQGFPHYTFRPFTLQSGKSFSSGYFQMHFHPFR